MKCIISARTTKYPDGPESDWMGELYMGAAEVFFTGPQAGYKNPAAVKRAVTNWLSRYAAIFPDEIKWEISSDL